MGKQADKTQRHRLRELAELAYERELARALSDLEDDFKRWRAGETNAFALSESIHEFHQGAARDLFSMYGRTEPELIVARALHEGILSMDEMGDVVIKQLAGHLKVLKESSR
jgi:hypothetical protein